MAKHVVMADTATEDRRSGDPIDLPLTARRVWLLHTLFGAAPNSHDEVDALFEAPVTPDAAGEFELVEPAADVPEPA